MSQEMRWDWIIPITFNTVFGGLVFALGWTFDWSSGAIGLRGHS